MSTAVIPRTPQRITSGAKLRRVVIDAQRGGNVVGLVPTMGALHEGHLSLVDRARRECGTTVATIFVNPTQFGPGEDYRNYPRDLDTDLRLLSQRDCDIVFVPAVEEMFPSGCGTSIDVGEIARPLEGEHRPGHFAGVATIVMKLFQLAPVDYAYFGQKDYQQTLVIKQMVNDLNVPIEIRVCPTVRESDGLAMSSRNAYLTGAQRQRATVLYDSLQLATAMARAGNRNVQELRQAMLEQIADVSGVAVHYIAFLAEGTVTPVSTIAGPTVVAVAAQFGKARLIDNCIIR